MPQIPPCPMPIDSSCGNMSSRVSGFIEPTDQQPYQQQRTPKSQGGQQPYQQQRSPKDQDGRFPPKWPKKFEHDWANTGWEPITPAKQHIAAQQPSTAAQQPSTAAQPKKWSEEDQQAFKLFLKWWHGMTMSWREWDDDDYWAWKAVWITTALDDWRQTWSCAII